jgi:hypothetical protein
MGWNPALFERRECAHLLQKAELVGHRPVFHELAAGNTVHGDPFDGDDLPVRGDAEDLSCEGAPPAETGDDLIPFRDLILDGVHRIWEGDPE